MRGKAEKGRVPVFLLPFVFKFRRCVGGELEGHVHCLFGSRQEAALWQASLQLSELQLYLCAVPSPCTASLLCCVRTALF